jgi:hypothetical protein
LNILAHAKEIFNEPATTLQLYIGYNSCDKVTTLTAVCCEVYWQSQYDFQPHILGPIRNMFCESLASDTNGAFTLRATARRRSRSRNVFDFESGEARSEVAICFAWRKEVVSCQDEK